MYGSVVGIIAISLAKDLPREEFQQMLNIDDYGFGTACSIFYFRAMYVSVKTLCFTDFSVTWLFQPACPLTLLGTFFICRFLTPEISIYFPLSRVPAASPGDKIRLDRRRRRTQPGDQNKIHQTQTD
jgi:hypothetical protein